MSPLPDARDAFQPVRSNPVQGGLFIAVARIFPVAFFLFFCGALLERTRLWGGISPGNYAREQDFVAPPKNKKNRVWGVPGYKQANP